MQGTKMGFRESKGGKKKRLDSLGSSSKRRLEIARLLVTVVLDDFVQMWKVRNNRYL